MAIAGESVTSPNVPHASQLKLFLRFQRLGLCAWGGPVAQIAMLRYR